MRKMGQSITPIVKPGQRISDGGIQPRLKCGPQPVIGLFMLYLGGNSKSNFLCAITVKQHVIGPKVQRIHGGISAAARRRHNHGCVAGGRMCAHFH